MKLMPAGLATLFCPKDITRTMYPFGGWECLEIAPLMRCENSTPFIGYNIGGQVGGSESRQEIETNINSSKVNLAKLDAWGRLQMQNYLHAPSAQPFEVPVYAPYTIAANGLRLYHPFFVPFMYVRRENVVTNDLTARAQSEHSVVLSTFGVTVTSPWSDYTVSQFNRVVR